MAEKANISERGTCRSECGVTWHSEHGGSVPGGPFPGTHGGPGDVRRCEHGSVWLWEEEFQNRYWCFMDRWRRLHPFWNRRQYRQAVAALDAEAAALRGDQP
jgi:hypothetical protein